MKALKKAETLPIRFSTDELRRARQAAKIVSQSRGEIVAVGTLIREQAMRGIEAILSPQQDAGERRIGDNRRSEPASA